MSNITAVLLANKLVSGNKVNTAYALLIETETPYWEIHIGGSNFRFCPHQDHLLEDGLWNLMDYCQMYDKAYLDDMSNNEPISVEEEFGYDIVTENRANLPKRMENFYLDLELLLYAPSKFEDRTAQLTLMIDLGITPQVMETNINPYDYIVLLKMNQFMKGILRK